MNGWNDILKVLQEKYSNQEKSAITKLFFTNERKINFPRLAKTEGINHHYTGPIRNA
jgi:hypothetical protein